MQTNIIKGRENLVRKDKKSLMMLSFRESPFLLLSFKRKFQGKQTTTTNFTDFFDELINDLAQSGKIGNRDVYRNVRNSVMMFANGKVNFEDVNVTFLNKFEVWLASDKYDRKGCSPRDCSNNCVKIKIY